MRRWLLLLTFVTCECSSTTLLPEHCAVSLPQDVHKDVRTKQVPNANITLQIQWVPFDFTF